jgi:hypothetical protein
VVVVVVAGLREERVAGREGVLGHRRHVRGRSSEAGGGWKANS